MDDTLGCCPTQDLTDKMKHVDRIACKLLGPGAMETTKMRNGRRLDMLGYTLDLDTQCASIARENVLRCIYGFFLIDPHTREIIVVGESI